MGTAYEEMQSQNARLLQKLTEQDDAYSKLQAERIKVRWEGGVAGGEREGGEGSRG
jgi:hypothetical protein